MVAVSSVIPARRRAERFDALVESTRSASAGDASDAAPYARLLELVGDLRAVTGPTPRPDFVSELRASLMTEADVVLQRLERDLALPAARRSVQRHPHRRLAIAAGALTFVGAAASVSVASQATLPGDALYPVKRAIENAQTGLSSGDDKTQGILGNASARLDEVAGLSDRSTAESDAQVPATIHDFTEQAQQGATRALDSNDDNQITALREFTATSMEKLQSLDSVVPAQARDELASAAQIISTLDQQALTECATCGGAVLDLPPIFLSAVSDTIPSPNEAVPTSPPPANGGATPPATQPSSGPSANLPSGNAPTLPGSTPSGGPVLPTDGTTSNGPLDDLTDGLLPSGGTASNPLGPITSSVSSAVDDTLGGLGGLLGP
jgi:hypothetical protein